MRHAVAGLEGALLDAAVAKALGIPFRLNGPCFANPEADPSEPQDLMCTFEPSSYWEHGGQIIDRARITIAEHEDGGWVGIIRGVHEDVKGPTHLVAAMRAFVASKFGEEVELP